jgi:hypothetical protein
MTTTTLSAPARAPRRAGRALSSALPVRWPVERIAPDLDPLHIEAAAARAYDTPSVFRSWERVRSTARPGTAERLAAALIVCHVRRLRGFDASRDPAQRNPNPRAWQLRADDLGGSPALRLAAQAFRLHASTSTGRRACYGSADPGEAVAEITASLEARGGRTAEGDLASFRAYLATRDLSVR